MFRLEKWRFGGLFPDLNISKGFRLALGLIVVAAVSYLVFSFAFSVGYSFAQRFHVCVKLLGRVIQRPLF